MTLFKIIKSDLYRYHGRCNLKEFIKEYLTNKGFRLTFWLRIANHFQNNKLLLTLPKLMYNYQKRVLVTDINYKAEIGPGFCLFHVFGTTFGPHVKIGKNFVMSHGVTIGGTKRGNTEGFPIIGDDVYVGPGALIVGGITIGNNVAIGGNAVVTKDVPDNSVVVGIPGKVISDKGASAYVYNTDYEGKI